MAVSTATVAALVQPEIDGVRLKRHPLELEASRSLQIAKRVGRRLVRWIRVLEREEVTLQRVVGRDPESGRDLFEDVKNAEGEPIMVPVLPDEDFRKSWDLYERTVRSLLAEQRMRYAMVREQPPITDEQYKRDLAELARDAVLNMPRAELEQLLRQRHVDIVANATNAQPTGQTSGAPAHGDDTEGTTAEGPHPSVSEADSSAGAPASESGNGDFLDFESGNDD